MGPKLMNCSKLEEVGTKKARQSVETRVEAPPRRQGIGRSKDKKKDYKERIQDIVD